MNFYIKNKKSHTTPSWHIDTVRMRRTLVANHVGIALVMIDTIIGLWIQNVTIITLANKDSIPIDTV